ncbi:hypothetical protein [Streptomyces sp. AP-93]|uniref:hypothetical protein n=1 Tax=Streptomyces sp. AP-93 TaxID=2929048 RepID=UPI001FAFDCC8|nr:hypothetical protein [Streptomyces sp. AP-93]MCJ0868072.1 hypothetical protein [Streptomyces sp. AP-93]
MHNTYAPPPTPAPAPLSNKSAAAICAGLVGTALLFVGTLAYAKAADTAAADPCARTDRLDREARTIPDTADNIARALDTQTLAYEAYEECRIAGRDVSPSTSAWFELQYEIPRLSTTF